MKHNIILASQSAARQTMLKQAGIIFEAMPSFINEERFHTQTQDAGQLSLLLAKEKALAISQQHNNKYIIGSDQVLEMNNRIYSKARSKEEAIKRLKEFSGKTHTLYSSVSVARGNEIIFEYTDKATLTMKALSDNFIKNYAEKAGNILTSCVGCYAIEGIGIRLFQKIEGDYFTILGMPLVPLLNFLDQEGVL